MEVILLTLPPGSETPSSEHYGEVVGITLQGTGCVRIGKYHLENLSPDTTLVIPVHVPRKVGNTGEEDLVILIVRGLVRLPEE